MTSHPFGWLPAARPYPGTWIGASSSTWENSTYVNMCQPVNHETGPEIWDFNSQTEKLNTQKPHLDGLATPQWHRDFRLHPSSNRESTGRKTSKWWFRMPQDCHETQVAWLRISPIFNGLHLHITFGHVKHHDSQTWFVDLFLGGFPLETWMCQSVNRSYSRNRWCNHYLFTATSM